jgi:tetratricopeptide (TPR) repeat protein
MVVPLFLAGFEERNLAVLGNGVFSGPRLVVDGDVREPNAGQYTLLDNGRKPVVIRLRRRFLDPIPEVEVRGNLLQIIPPFHWYEHFWMSLTGFLAYFNIILGMLVALGAYTVNTRVFRSYTAGWLKYLASGIVSGLAVFVFVVAIFTYLFASERIRLASLESSLNATGIHEIHHSHPPYLPPPDPGVSVDKYGYPRVNVDRPQIVDLLKKQQFSRLNVLLDSLGEGYERDFRQEFRLAAGYQSFAINDSSLEQTFSLWVARFPRSHVPLLARATFHEYLGWESRGYGWANETSSGRFEKMEKYFEQAEADVGAALALRPSLVIGYRLLMRIASARGDQAAEAILVRNALTLCSYSLLTRAQYMVDLTPRWGGSYSAMERFAGDAEEFADVNPRLAVLRGYILWDQGRVIEGTGDLKKALGLYTEALTYGPAPSFFSQRASVYLKLKRYDYALADLHSALALTPGDPDLLSDLAQVEYLRGEDGNALEQLRTAYLVDPHGYHVNWVGEWIAGELVTSAYEHYKRTDYEGALALYNRAVLYDPRYAENYFYRAGCYSALGLHNDALVDARRASELDPHNLAYAKFVDDVLAREKRWDEIIGMWDKFIESNPGNGKAYLERGEANDQKGDLSAALRDARMACKLGEEGGCRQVEMLNARGVK